MNLKSLIILRSTIAIATNLVTICLSINKIHIIVQRIAIFSLISKGFIWNFKPIYDLKFFNSQKNSYIWNILKEKVILDQHMLILNNCLCTAHTNFLSSLSRLVTRCNCFWLVTCWHLCSCRGWSIWKFSILVILIIWHRPLTFHTCLILRS